MTAWEVTWEKEIEFKDATLVAGLPGIGNVGKIAVDFLVDGLKAEKVASFFSYTLPHSVFVGEDNLVAFPAINLWHVKGKKRDLLLLGGDVQPPNEVSCYSFCDTLLASTISKGLKEVITLGGVGLRNEPKDPKVYCTGVDKKHVTALAKKTGANPELHGVVGPIIGVSGVLLGLSQKRGIPCSSLLVETLGHPMYLGIVGAKKVLVSLGDYLSLKLNLAQIDKDLASLEEEAKVPDSEAQALAPQAVMSKIKGKLSKDMDYIG